MGFPHGSNSKESASNDRDLGSIPGLGRSPGEGHGNPFHYSCLENLMDRGAWQAIYSPWGPKESDRIDATMHKLEHWVLISLIALGSGNSQHSKTCC